MGGLSNIDKSIGIIAFFSINSFKPRRISGGFLFNLLIAFVVTRGIYYPKNRNRNNVFTFMAFNTIIFFVISVLTSVEISIGVGFGLFAIFGILRYRTDPMPVRDMTYLFIILALPVINSIMVSEALYLKKPILSIPVKNQFEQVLNAKYLEELGYGEYQTKTTPEIIKDFLKKLPEYEKNTKKYKQEGNKILFKEVDKAIKEVLKK